MRLFTISSVLVTLALLSGCARSRITTEIKANGLCARTVALTGQQKKEGMSMGGSLEEAFVFPSGPGWKSHEEKKNDDRTMIFERTLTLGRPLKGDLSIKGEEGKLNLVNEVTVTR